MATTEEALKKSLDKMDLTDAEAKRMADCFKQEEFQQMFAEYMKEMADPKVREQRELEIQQMETNAGIVTTTPNRGFCFKVLVDHPKKEGEEPVEDKVFFNICYSDSCDEATSTPGKGGEAWSIPHSYLPPRDEKDAKGNPCKAVDVTIGTKTYQKTKDDQRFQRLIIQTATEAFEKNEKIKLQRTFKVMKQMSYKGADGPAKFMVKGEPGAEPSVLDTLPKANPSLPSKDGGKASKETMQALADAMANAPIAVNPPAKSKSVVQQPDRPVSQPKKKPLVEEVTKTDSKKAKKPAPTGPIQPKYKVIERQPFDMSNHLKGREQRYVRPSELVVTIELPQLEDRKLLDLELNDRAIHLEAGQLYLLDIRLGYEVDEDNGSAKYDKAKRTLTLTLPVVPAKEEEEGEEEKKGPVAEEAEEAEEVEPQEEEGEEGDGEDEAAIEVLPEGDEDEPPVVGAAAQLRAAKEKQRAAKAEMEAQRAAAKASRAGISDDPADGNAAGDAAGTPTSRDAEDNDDDDDDSTLDQSLWPSDKFPCALKTTTECSAHDSANRPSFSFRQTETECTVVVRVENIVPSSLVIGFRKRQVAASFEDKSGERHHIHYYLQHAIVPGKCTYDLSEFNLVVTLVKQRAHRHWPRFEASVVPVTLADLQEEGVIASDGPVKLENDVMFELD